jgi:hypothetical protein
MNDVELARVLKNTLQHDEIVGHQRLSKRNDRRHAATSRAFVSESPLAKSVTSWPCRTSSSVRYDTARSVPP